MNIATSRMGIAKMAAEAAETAMTSAEANGFPFDAFAREHFIDIVSSRIDDVLNHLDDLLTADDPCDEET